MTSAGRRSGYAAVFSINDLRECLDGQGLCQTGDTFEEHMAVREECDEKGIDKVFLSDDCLVHPSCDELDKVVFRCDELV